jgi:hypothetical protein
MSQFWICEHSHQWDAFINHVRHLQEDKGRAVFKWSFDKPRTAKQQAAIEVFCRNVSQEFNVNNITVQVIAEIAKRGIDWTQVSVKEIIWRNMQRHLTGKESSKDLNTKEVGQVYEHINKYVLSEAGVYVPWPEKKQ